MRYVEGPDGRLELRDTPLTPEDFLDPQIDDILSQGIAHDRMARYLTDLLERRLDSRPDILVLHELKHLLGPGLPGPGPDVSVIVGLRDPDPDMEIYDVAATGIPPSLIIEVLCPLDQRLREVDERVKPKLYAQIGVEEYMLVALAREDDNRRVQLSGYRLDDQGRYQPMAPDAQGRLLSRVTGLLFGVSAQGDRIEVFVAATEERLLSSQEEEVRRKAAEAELARLREGLKRLRGE